LACEINSIVSDYKYKLDRKERLSDTSGLYWGVGVLMGWAITANEEKEDMELIKEIGATSIRLAHYQHNQNLYELCDQEGMVVWVEIPFISVMSQNELDGINVKQQMRELIK
jgi:beta-galactosidase/beta-glucuronidase